MAFQDPATVFVDVERLNGEDMTKLPAICDSLIAAGVGGVRCFIPYAPDMPGFGYWTDATQPPSDARINRTLDGWAYILSRGLKLIGGFSDENNPVAVTGASQPMMQAHITNCARLAAARNFPTESFAPEPVNEWAGWGDNTKTNPIRQRYFQILRAAMPNHTIIMTGDYWGYFKNMSGMWTPGTADTNWEWMVHSYEDHTQADWSSIMKTAVATAAAAGVRVFWGEFGNTANAANLDIAANMTDWQNTVYNATQAGGPLGVRIALWAVTDGAALRLNVGGGWALKPQVISTIQWAMGSAYKSAATSTPAAPVAPVVTTPTAPATPTAPVVTPATPAAPAAPASTPLSVKASVTATNLLLDVTKATGQTNTIRASFGKTAVVLADGAADREHTYTLPLPAPGSYTANITLDGNSAMASAAFTVPAATVTPAAPAPVVPNVSDIVAALPAASAVQLAAVRTTLGIKS